MNTCYEELLLKSATNQYTLTVVANPASATCTLTYGGQSYSSKSATVDSGTVISYSIYHSTYGTTTGTITMNSHKTLTCNGTYSTSSSYTSYTSPTNMTSNGTWDSDSFAVKADFTSHRGDFYLLFDGNTSTVGGTSASTTKYVQGYSISSGNIYCCCPNPIKLSQATCYVVNSSSYGLCPASYTLYGSNTDGSNWTSLGSYTKPSGTISTGDAWSITSNNTEYYKYFRWYFAGRSASGASTQFTLIELRMTGEEQITAYTYYWDKTITNVKTDTIPWEQPILSANGTLGGSDFAVEASAERSSTYAAWKAFDDDSSSSYWSPSTAATSAYTYTFYNPDKLNVTEIQYKFTGTTYATTIDSIEGSDDGVTWTTISKTDTTDSNIVTSTLSNTESYKYYKTTFTPLASGTYRLRNMLITATQKI